MRIAVPTDRSYMLNHPQLRLALYVCQLPLWLGRASRCVRLETPFSQTLCFYSESSRPPFACDDDRVLYLPLTSMNLPDVVCASATLPLLMEPSMHIHGLPNAYYCDAV